MIPRNSVIVKEISKRTHLTVEEVCERARVASEKCSVSYRDALKELFTHYVLESDECPVCYERLEVGVSIVKCEGCASEFCTRCLVNYMRHNNEFPRCTNANRCDSTLDDFALMRSINREDLKKTIFPAIKEVLWAKKQEDIQRVVVSIQTNGYSRTKIPNPDKLHVYNHVIKPQHKTMKLVDRLKSFIAKEWGGTRTRSKCTPQHLFEKIRVFLLDSALSDSEVVHSLLSHIDQFDDVRGYINFVSLTLRKVSSSYRLASRDYRRMQSNVYTDIHGNTYSASGVKKNKKPFIKRCVSEGCNGYLSEEWTCLKCKQETCSECHTLVSDSHVCDPSEVASVREKMRITKPCPECGTRIQRPWGCNHMFCVACHTGFDWESGKKISDRVNTNPYLRKIRAEGTARLVFSGECVEDVPPLPDFDVLCEKFRVIDIPKSIADTIMAFRDLIDPEHGNTYTTGSFHEHHPEDRIDVNVRHIERYIAGMIPEKRLKDILFRTYRTDTRHAHIRAVIHTLENVGCEILHSFVYSDVCYEETVGCIESLRALVNASFRDVSDVFGYAHGCYVSPALLLFEHALFHELNEVVCRDHRVYNDGCSVCESVYSGDFDHGISVTNSLLVERRDYTDMYRLNNLHLN